MKLYTEEQVREMMETYFNFGDSAINYAVSRMNPIELPSNEEIDKFAQIASFNKKEKTQGEWIAYISVIAGAKWVIEQIKQQANGK